MDGALYAIGPLVAFCTVLLIIAEPLRNTGTYTLGDVIHYRMKRPPALAAAVLGTIVINLAYMVPQMAGGGVLLKLLFGLPYDISVVLVGLGMIVYVAAGGMLATSWVQIVKAVLRHRQVIGCWIAKAQWIARRSATGVITPPWRRRRPRPRWRMPGGGRNEI